MRHLLNSPIGCTTLAFLAGIALSGCTEDEDPIELSKADVAQSAAANGGENLVLETVFRDLFVGESATAPNAVASIEDQPIANAAMFTLPVIVAHLNRESQLAMLPDAESITFSSTGSTIVDLGTSNADLDGHVSVSWDGNYTPTTATGFGPYPASGSVSLSVTIEADDADNQVSYATADGITATWATGATWEAQFNATWRITGDNTWEMTAEMTGALGEDSRSFSLDDPALTGTVVGNTYYVSVGVIRRGPARNAEISSAFFNADRSMLYRPTDATTPETSVTWQMLNGAVWVTANGVTDGPLTPAIVEFKYGVDPLHFAP
jgi:hypothetical protein